MFHISILLSGNVPVNPNRLKVGTLSISLLTLLPRRSLWHSSTIKRPTSLNQVKSASLLCIIPRFAITTLLLGSISLPPDHLHTSFSGKL